MKFLFKISAMIIISSHVLADSDADKFKGDQALQDGFHTKAWDFYMSSYRNAEFGKKTTLLNRLSLAAEKSGKAATTIKEMEDFLKLKRSKSLEGSKLATLYLNKCNLELTLKRYRNAAKSCKIILSKAEKLPESTLQTALNFAVFSLTKAGALDAASKLIEKHLNSFADVAKAELQNARLKILLGQYINAISILDKYKSSKNAMPAFLRFWAFYKANEGDRASIIFNNHIVNFTESPDPVFTNVMIKYSESIYQDEIIEATNVLDKAFLLESNPDVKAHIILKRAELLIKTERIDDAIKTLLSFQKAYPKSNKILEVYSQLAELYTQKSDNEDLNQAENYLALILQSDTKSSALYFDSLIKSGNIHLKKQEFSKAAENYSKAAEVAVSSKQPAEKVSYSVYMTGFSQYLKAASEDDKTIFLSAAESFKKVIDYNTGFTEEAFIVRAASLRKAEKYKIAVDVLEAMLTRYPKNKDALYLLGLSRLASGEITKGIKTLTSFVQEKPNDPRSPDALLESLKAAIYGLDKRQSFIKSLEVIENFESYKRNSELSKIYEPASPAILHLKAVLFWKQNRGEEAEKNWTAFLNLYPENYLAIEVKLWLAFKKIRGPAADVESALMFYNDAVTMHKESILTGFALWQFSKALHKNGEFENAYSKIKAAENFYKEQLPSASASRNLASVLFFTGEIHSSMGEYESAVEVYREALKFTSDKDMQTAIRGRIGDCRFSQATKLSDDSETDFEEFMSEAKEAFTDIYKMTAGNIFSKEQALYKLAKCHEFTGLQKDSEAKSGNSEIAKALEYYWELFFNHNDRLKKGIRTNPYYFCRTGYDLARLQLMFDEPDIRSAVNTYSILAKSKLPGTSDAAILARQLNRVLSGKK